MSFSSPAGNWERMLINLSKIDLSLIQKPPISVVKVAFRDFKELKYSTARSYAEIVYAISTQKGKNPLDYVCSCSQFRERAVRPIPCTFQPFHTYVSTKFWEYPPRLQTLIQLKCLVVISLLQLHIQRLGNCSDSSAHLQQSINNNKIKVCQQTRNKNVKSAYTPR